MPDLIPEGCISLRSVYKHVLKGLWGEPSPFSDVSYDHRYTGVHPEIVGQCRARLRHVRDHLLSELVAAFAHGSLEAFVRPPGSDENYTIPPDSWDSAEYPERVFLDTEVVYRHGGYWDGIVGRTPFVRRVQFDPWLTDQVARRGDARATPSPANQALREHLIGLAMNGVMGSTEVEELARKWLMPRLASEADYLNPMQVPRWTLCMAVVWITWSDVDAVREVMDDYCADTWNWRSCTRHVQVEGGKAWCTIDGEELVCLLPENLALVGIQEADGSDPREASKRMSVLSAREQLWQALTEGKLAATGIDSSGNIAIIPAHEWGYLSLAHRRKGADYLVFSNDTCRKAYTDITVPRDELFANWPASAEQPAQHEPLPCNSTVHQKRRKADAIRQAIAALYPNDIPAGLSDKQLLNEVNEWLGNRANSKVSVSVTSLRRVIHMN